MSIDTYPVTQMSMDVKMSKIKVLCLSLWYPLSMSRYFEKAFRHREDVEFLTCGVYTGSWIPWLGGMNVDEKYAIPPDIDLPFRNDIGRINYDLVRARLPQGWEPDIVLTIDAGICWKEKPSQGMVVHMATDPHVLNYDHQRSISDKFFNMQKVYSQPGDIYLPYAYSKYDFYPDTLDELYEPYRGKDTDACLIGMPYENRVRWVDELRKRGMSVIFENGPIFDEARHLYSRSRIGLNWSSMDDLNCRAFELPAMKLCPVMNEVSDMGLFLTPGQDYLPFRDLRGAVDQVLWAKNNPERARQIAENGYNAIRDETYDKRVEQILKECSHV